MIDFLRNLRETVQKYPERPAVVDHDGSRVTSYRELFSAALRVNAWLREHGFGREKVCAIYLPKGMEYIAARIGIMAAGCAWAGLEDLMGKERIDYVIQDSGCQVVFDIEKWAQAMQLPPCESIADPDPHDLAFIIYTSGSTGRPKGSAQEYGVYKYISRGGSSAVVPYSAPEPLQFADVAPQTYVSGIYTMVGVFGIRGTIHEISGAMVRDPKALTRYFIEYGIQHTFMTPTLFSLLIKDSGICLRAACTGGEIVSNVYTDRFDIFNIYGPSEMSFPVCLFRLDKVYENTPIGFPATDSEILLLDEKERPADEGVFCIHLPYSRGYVNTGKENGFIHFYGKKYFRTSDYIRRDASGKYIFLDRLDDMVKLNGNRVDIRETEAAVRQIPGVDSCCVRLYRINGIKALCAYYTGGRDIDSMEAAQILRRFIPEYMIPACYIRLQRIPLNANGKIDRNALPQPNGQLRIVPYAAPKDELEKKLCALFRSAQNTDEDVGLDDDFFLLGGDSIRAMEALSHCRLTGLTVQMIYEGRTVRKIASLLRSAEVSQMLPPDPPDRAALNTEQLYLLKRDLRYPGSCMLNLPLKFTLPPYLDLKKLASAVSSVVRAHPVLHSIIEEQNNVYYLCRRPMECIAFPVEKMTDSELEAASKAFVRPFHLNGEPLFRCRILQGKTRRALLLDVYHVICDGYSLRKLLEDIGSAYNGKALAADWSYPILKEEAERRGSAAFNRDMSYFADRYDHPGQNTIPLPDHETEENTDGRIFLPLRFDQMVSKDMEEKFGLGRSGFYLAATALSLAAFNDSEDIMLNWTWHGRSDNRRMDSIGFFLRNLPLTLHLKQGLLLSSLLEDISEQIRKGISHGSVSYWDEQGSYGGKDLVCLIYQGGLYDYNVSDGILGRLEDLPMPAFACSNTLDIEILDSPGRFGVLLDYNASKYEQESMNRFGNIFCRICDRLLQKNMNTSTVWEII